MKIGILLCDHINPKLANEFDDYPRMFRELFTHYAPEVELYFYDLTRHEIPHQIDDCDAYMSTGSAASIHDEVKWIHEFEDLVRLLYARHKKFIGICFGHQMIAKALGGEVAESRNGWGVGSKLTEVIHQKPWMQPVAKTYNLLVSHSEQVIELPTGAELIASNEHCPNAMFQMGDHFLAIQAHPEYCPDYARALMDFRRNKIDRDCRQAAQGSLDKPLDSQLIMKWMLKFLGA